MVFYRAVCNLLFDAGGSGGLVERQHVTQSDVKDYICHKGPDMLKKGPSAIYYLMPGGGGVEATVFILQRPTKAYIFRIWHRF